MERFDDHLDTGTYKKARIRNKTPNKRKKPMYHETNSSRKMSAYKSSSGFEASEAIQLIEINDEGE